MFFKTNASWRKKQKMGKKTGYNLNKVTINVQKRKKPVLYKIR